MTTLSTRITLDDAIDAELLLRLAVDAFKSDAARAERLGLAVCAKHDHERAERARRLADRLSAAVFTSCAPEA